MAASATGRRLWRRSPVPTGRCSSTSQAIPANGSWPRTSSPAKPICCAASSTAGPERPLARGGRPAAGKTGTTDGQSDANFLGFTPQLATFIWHGNATARVPGAGFGGDVPARVFKRYMDAALENQPVVQFPDPGPVCARPPSQSSVLGGGTTAPDDDALIESTPNRSAPNRPAPTQPPPQTAPSPKPTSPTTIPPTTPPTVPPTSPGGQ